MSLAGRKVLVTGGTGFIGGALVERLILHCDADVRVLVRNFSRASRLARFKLQMTGGDISSQTSVEEAASMCEVIFHCAYDFAGGRKQSEQVNVNGTENVAKVALKHGMKLVHVSTVDVYGWPAKGKIDETSEKSASGSLYAETKLAAERTVLEYHERYGLNVTVLQPTIVYGPFSRPWTINPVRQLKSGKVVLVDGGEGCCNALYVDDVIDALLLAAACDDAAGETFLISGPEPVTWREFYTAYEEMLGVDATMSMSARELEKTLLTSGGRTEWISEWRELMAILRSPDSLARLQRVPLAGRLYRLLRDQFPKGGREFLRQKVLSREMTSRKAEIETPSPPLWLPDQWRLRVLRSRAEIRIDKAKSMLVYTPRFEFKRGMALTAEYMRWANLV